VAVSFQKQPDRQKIAIFDKRKVLAARSQTDKFKVHGMVDLLYYKREKLWALDKQ